MTFETVLLDFLSLPFLVETFRILTGGCMCSSSHMGSKSNVAMHAEMDLWSMQVGMALKIRPVVFCNFCQHKNLKTKVSASHV